MDKTAQEPPNTRQVWIDQANRIASFHEEKDFEPMLLNGQEEYERFIHSMQEQGYRFQ